MTEGYVLERYNHAWGGWQPMTLSMLSEELAIYPTRKRAKAEMERVAAEALPRTRFRVVHKGEVVAHMSARSPASY